MSNPATVPSPPVKPRKTFSKAKAMPPKNRGERLVLRSRYNAFMQALAANPCLSNGDLARMVGTREGTVGHEAQAARRDLGIFAKAADHVLIEPDVYLPKCRELNVTPVEVPPSREIPRKAHLSAKVLSGPVRIHLFGARLDLFRFLAAHPGASNHEVLARVPSITQTADCSWVRQQLGIRYGGGYSRGYKVNKGQYLAGCEKYGLTPIEIPPDGFFPHLRFENMPKNSKIETVPTAEVPPDVLAATPRELRPPMEPVMIAAMGGDKYEQLKGAISLVRTEMARLNIESLTIDPSDVTIHELVRTVRRI